MAESPTLRDGATFLLQSSSGSTYQIKNVGGVYSCSCPGWRNQSRNSNYRSCKHLLQYRGAQDEAVRINPGGWDNIPATIERQLVRFRPVTTRTASTPLPTSTASSQARVPSMLAPSASGISTMRCSICAGTGHNARTCSYGRSTPGGGVLQHPVTVTATVIKGKAASPASPPPARNAWTALMDGNFLADDDPPAPLPAVIQAVSEATDEEGGEAKLAVLLAHSWDGVTDPTGYMMSEKLDGVRAYWDGENFRSRLDNVFAVPDWYKEGMPKEHLDGEFWMERGKFQETSGLVRRQDKSDLWRKIRFMAFDAPNLPGGFETRYLALGTLLSSGSSNAERLLHNRCRNLTDLQIELRRIEELGGEGLMLREPGSLYVRGRSTSLLKVKTFFDSEATVIGTKPGKGKHRGRVGALIVRVPRTVNLTVGKKTCTLLGGTEFDVGTGLSDAQRSEVWDSKTITFRFQELTTAGVPRFPSFVGTRNYE